MCIYIYNIYIYIYAYTHTHTRIHTFAYECCVGRRSTTASWPTRRSCGRTRRFFIFWSLRARCCGGFVATFMHACKVRQGKAR